MANKPLELGRPTHISNKKERFKLSVNISKTTVRDMKMYLAADESKSFKSQSEFVENAIRNYMQKPIILSAMESILKRIVDNKTVNNVIKELKDNM